MIGLVEIAVVWGNSGWFGDPFDGQCREAMMVLPGRLTDASQLTDCSQLSHTECMNQPTINPTCL